MKSILKVVLALFLTTLIPSAHAAEGDELWLATFGGMYQDRGHDIALTLDGGFVLTGSTQSDEAGDLDIYLVKLASDGTVDWEYAYGSAADDVGNAVIQTPDGGYLVAGRRQFDTYDFDGLVLKVDSAGVEQWQETYGGGAGDEFHDVTACADGGYTLVGKSWFPMEWIVKLDADGVLKWERFPCIGEPGFGYLRAVVETASGDLVVAGYSGQSDVYPPYYNAKLVRFDAEGEIVWIRSFDHSLDDRGYDVIEVPDGGFAVAGTAAGDMVVWRTDENGALTWYRRFGLPTFDEARSLIATPDGGFLVGGHSYDLDTGYYRIFVGKTDDAGQIMWDRYYAGAGEQLCQAITATADGNYALLGTTAAEGAGGEDLVLMTLEGPGVLTTAGGWPAAFFRRPLLAAPNPFNPRTVIRFELAARARAELEILDVKGRLVRTLTSGEVLPAGSHEVGWNGRDNKGYTAPSGTYVVRARAGRDEVASKILLLR